MVHHKISTFLHDPRFQSDCSCDDPSKFYKNPPFSLESQKKIIEGLSSIYYCGPYNVSLEVDYQELPDDFFPMKIIFLQPEESRKILIHNTLVAQLPGNIRESASKLKNIHNSAWVPCSWSYPKDTYLKWIYNGSQGCVQEIKWTNLFQNNILGSEDYIKDDWDRTLQNTSQFLLMKNDGSGFNLVQNRSDLFNLAMYYGADEKDSYPNGTDIMFINNHGNVFYYNECFFDRNHTNYISHKLHFSLKADGFYPPEDLYNFAEVTFEESEAKVDLFDNFDPSAKEYIEEQRRELAGQ